MDIRSADLAPSVAPGDSASEYVVREVCSYLIRCSVVVWTMSRGGKEGQEGKGRGRAGDEGRKGECHSENANLPAFARGSRWHMAREITVARGHTVLCACTLAQKCPGLIDACSVLDQVVCSSRAV